MEKGSGEKGEFSKIHTHPIGEYLDSGNSGVGGGVLQEYHRAVGEKLAILAASHGFIAREAGKTTLDQLMSGATQNT